MITYTLTNATVALYDSFEGLVNWCARNSYGERSAMTTACIHKLSFSGLGKFSLIDWVLMGFSLGSTFVSANIVSGLHVFNKGRGKRRLPYGTLFRSQVLSP